MATCTVTFTVNTAALSDTVFYEPLPNQIIDGVAIDNARITATASGTTYTAVLVRGAQYQIVSTRFRYLDPIFTVPEAATADLDDLLAAARTA